MKLKRFLSGCFIAGLIASAGIAEETMWGFTTRSQPRVRREEFADELEYRNRGKYRLESSPRRAVLRWPHQDRWQNIYGHK